MTNAIETTRREMFNALTALRGKIQINYSIKDMSIGADEFEHALEAHLEALRMLNENQRIIIEEAGGTNDLQCRLSEMTQERDDCQSRLQAVDHAYFVQSQANISAGKELREVQHLYRRAMQALDGREFQLAEARKELAMLRESQGSTSAQDSKEKGASEQPEAKALMIVLGALVDAQRIVTDWLVPDGVGAKKSMAKLMVVLDCAELVGAQKVFEGRKAK